MLSLPVDSPAFIRAVQMFLWWAMLQALVIVMQNRCEGISCEGVSVCVCVYMWLHGAAAAFTAMAVRSMQSWWEGWYERDEAPTDSRSRHERESGVGVVKEKPGRAVRSGLFWKLSASIHALLCG